MEFKYICRIFIFKNGSYNLRKTIFFCLFGKKENKKGDVSIVIIWDLVNLFKIKRMENVIFIYYHYNFLK